MKDAFGIEKGLKMPKIDLKTVGMSPMDKARFYNPSPGKPYIMPSKKTRLKRILRGKNRSKGLNLGPGRLTSAVNNTNGQPTKWAKGKPADWV